MNDLSLIEDLLEECRRLRRKYKKLKKNVVIIAKLYDIDIDVEELVIVQGGNIRGKDCIRRV